MFYTVVAFLMAIIGLPLVYFGFRLLFKGSWFWGWVRGTSGFFLLLLALGVGLIAWDMRNFHEIEPDKSVATISFEKIEHQAFIATLALTDLATTKDFYLKGDQWQIDARVLRWTGFMQRIGSKPGYLLERLAGRYLSIEDERNFERSVYSLKPENQFIPDLWLWLYAQKQTLPFVDAVYGSATFLPMADGALFEVVLTTSGLAAKPLNDAAKKAVTEWKP
jgi:hypothetical protein